MHRHGHAELTWIERGRGTRWVGDSVEPFGDGDVVLLGTEVPHVWLTGNTGSARSCAATVLQFPSSWAADTGLPELRSLEVLLRHAARGVAVEGGMRCQVQELMAQVVAANAPRRAALLIELLALMSQGLEQGSQDLRLLSAHPAQPGVKGHALLVRRQRVDRLLRWVQTHLSDDLCVSDAASIVGVSPAAFGRFFRREVGKGFIDYINDARCSWAALQLLEGSQPIADIALACGYPSLSNFGEQFRHRYGMSPREYRRRPV